MRRSVFEAERARKQRVAVVLNRDVLHGATGKPWTPKASQRIAPCDEGPKPGWKAKELIEGQRDKIRRIAAKAQGVAWQIGRRVQQHVKSGFVRSVHKGERMAYTGKVGLRGKREQLRATEVTHRSEAFYLSGQSQLGIERQVFDAGAGTAGELTDAVNGIVIVGAERARPVRRERIAFGDELDRARGVGREADGVLVWRRIEMIEDLCSCDLQSLSASVRWVAVGVRIAKNASP